MSIFSIGLSGIRAAQAGLFATSGNISNINTPGFNREIVNLSESKASGVKVDSIERQFNQFVASRLNAAAGSYASLETYYSQVHQIDKLMSDERSGLAPVMQEFFKAIGQVNSNPADPAARSGVMGTASTLTAQFRSFGNYLEDIESTVNEEVKFEINTINALSEQVAMLNKEILMARAAGKAPNSLLNQRDQVVHELSQKMDVRVYEQKSGSYSISMSNGFPLVASDTTFKLSAISDSSDPTRLVVGYEDVAGNEVQLKESVFNKGSLGGLLEFRSDTLDTMRNQLGQMVAVFADAMNQQHQLGIDLNQQPGGVMFDTGQTVTYRNSGNTGNAIATTDIIDTTALKATNYDIRQTPAGFEVTRVDNGKTVNATFDGVANTLEFDGLRVSFDAGAIANGDSFRVKPLANQVKSFELLLDDSSQFAAAQSNASGDNRNGLAMLDIQSQLLVEGKGTLSQAYGTMVSTLGNKINVVKANMAAQQGLTEQLHAVQQSESGVNLDEEAANLIRYQQYYQANAKVIETGSTILETILSLR